MHFTQLIKRKAMLLSADGEFNTWLVGMVGGQTGALNSGSHFMLPLLDQCVWWRICHSKFAGSNLRSNFPSKSLQITGDKKEKTIKHSSNSPSKVVNIKSSFKMIMPKISFFQITCRKWQQKVRFFLLLKGGKHRCCQVQCWAAAVSGHENVKDSSHLMCFIVLT